MDSIEFLNAISNIILAVAALAGLGGAGIYMVNRKQNGKTALPGSAHDETVRAIETMKKDMAKGLSGIQDSVDGLHETTKRNNGTARKEREDILNAVAPRRPLTGSGGGS